MGNHSVWEPYWRVWKGWKCLLECSITVNPTEKKFSVPRGHWVTVILVPGEAMPERLDHMKTSLCPLFRHLCHGCLHTNMQAHVRTICVCIYGMCTNIYGMCMVEAIYVICHICGIFLISPYIYIHSLTFKIFFSMCSDGSFWKMNNFCCSLFTEFKYRCLTLKRKFLFKKKWAYFPKSSERK